MDRFLRWLQKRSQNRKRHQQIKLSGWWSYFGSNGVMVTGWQKIGSKWYYFNDGGKMVTGMQVIGGKTYTFNSNGALQ